MLFSKVLQIVATTLLATTATAFDIDSKDNVVLYWGQSSAGHQESLAYYCESDAADIMVLSFMYQFPGTNNVPGLDFSSACSDRFGDGLLRCDNIAADILTCQSLGKKVLLSLGGAAGSYGFSSDEEAHSFADSLWNYFGEGTSSERPFGTSVIDGFDFDIENNNPNGYVALVNRLRELYATGSKDYYISAAPQCVYPDASVGDLMSNAHVDFAFVQFYNNYCNVDRSFNWQTWADYAVNTSPNKDIKLFLGLPASPTAAGTGYLNVDVVQNAVANVIGDNANFAGIMLWDASQLWANQVNGQNYAEAMKSILVANAPTSTAAPTTSTSTEAPTTTSSTESTSTEVPTTTEAAPTTETPQTTETPETTSTSTDAQTTSTEAPVTTELQTSTSETSSAVETTPEAVTTETTTDPLATVSVTLSTDEKLVTEPATTEPATTEPATTTSLPTTLAVVTTYATTSSETPLPTTTEAPLPSAPAPTTGFNDCSSLVGADRAKCMNHNFGQGLFLGSATSCNAGDYACTSDGQLAQCNFGEWVTFQCAAGTTCYAYSSGDYVSIGCNFSNELSQYTKRQEAASGHKHHFHK